MKLLVTGASGQLGSSILRESIKTGHVVTAWSGRYDGTLFGIPLKPVDLTKQTLVRQRFRTCKPDVVIHTAALSSIDQCYNNPERTESVNVHATQLLAELCREHSCRMIFTSTDLVFDGEKGNYNENDIPNPLSVYGKSKLHAETILLSQEKISVVRMSLLYGPTLIPNRGKFYDNMKNSLTNGKPIRCFADEWRTPLALTTAASGLLALTRIPHSGLIHFGGPERMSRYEMGLKLAEEMNISTEWVVANSRKDVTFPEPRPRDISLDSSLWRELLGEDKTTFKQSEV